MSKSPLPGDKTAGADATSPTAPGAAAEKHHPLQGALKGLLRVMPGVDLTQPADPAWGDAAEKD